MANETGWKPIPLSLKIVFVLSAFWVVGSLMGVSARYELGLPLFGMFVYGVVAVLVVLLLDIIGPAAFLVGIWKRAPWAPKVAYAYMGVFMLNSAVAALTVREQLGLMPIVVPLIVTAVLLFVVYTRRDYFSAPVL